MSVTIGFIIDIVIIALLVIFGLVGYKKGILKSIISLLNWVVCILIAVFTAKYVAGWLNHIFDFSGWIGSKISKSLIKSNDFFAMSVNSFGGKENLIASIPAGINGFLEKITKLLFNGNVDMSSTSSVGSIMGTTLGHITFIVITGILIFIILKIIVLLLSKLFKNISQTKVLGGLNKVLGLALGLVKAGLIIVIINIVLVIGSMIPFMNKTVAPLIQDHTYVEKYVYNTTDKLFGKYVIEGEMIQNWVEDKWENR